MSCAGSIYPAVLHRFLADPVATRPAATALAAMLPRLLSSVEDGRARRVVARIVPRILGGPGAGVVVARALRGMVDGRRHQEVLSFLLAQIKVLLAGREEALRVAIEERVREQGGRLVGWALGAAIARRVLATLTAELDKIDPDGSELRAAFDEWVRREITRMEEDPERARGDWCRRSGAWSRTTQCRPGCGTSGRGCASRWRPMRRGRHRTVAFFSGALANLGALLENDRGGARRRGTCDRRGSLPRCCHRCRSQLSEFIAGVVGGWDAATVTDRLELHIGKDLQYVRVNGTLVGFLVGGAAVCHAARHVRRCVAF